MAKATTGRIAPAFDLATDGGGRIRLSDFTGKKLVVYFYPADDTPGCTIEAIDFTWGRRRVQGDGNAVIVGISRTTKPPTTGSWPSTASGSPWPPTPVRRRSRPTACGRKTMFGRKYMGVERATFLIGTDGRVAQEWRKVRVAGHVDKVLAAAEAL